MELRWGEGGLSLVPSPSFLHAGRRISHFTRGKKGPDIIYSLHMCWIFIEFHETEDNHH